jgi:MFS family permease
MAIATLSAIASQLMVWLIPQHLNMIGAELSLGGIGVAMFSLAGGIGGIVMSRIAARRGEAAAAAVMLGLGIPFIAAYLGLMRYNWAPSIMFVGGFFCYGAYPILVSLARHSRGPRLGQRMGFIVGGIWLTACLFPMLLGPVVERVGAKPVLMAVPAVFAASGLLAAWVAWSNGGNRKTIKSNENN